MLHVDNDESEQLEVERSSPQSRVTKEVKCSESSGLSDTPHSIQHDSRLTSQRSTAPHVHGDDASQLHAPTSDERPSAAVSAGVTDERLDGGLTQEKPPPGAVTAAGSHAPSLTNSDHPPACAVEQLTDNKLVSDDSHVDNFMETDLGGAAVASDAACADAVSMAKPSPYSAEACSTSPTSCDTIDGATTKFGSSTPDDDDVDRKLAVELERLKNLVVSSQKTCGDETATMVSHRTDQEEACVEDLDDASASDSEDTLWLPFVAKVSRETLKCGDTELSHVVQQKLQNARDTASETASGLHTKHNGSLTDDRDMRLGAEFIADDSDDVTVSSEPAADNLSPATAAVDHLQAEDKVSCTEQHSDSESTSSHAQVHSMLADNALQQNVSFSATDSLNNVLKQNSAANTALADVILEAEHSLLSFLGLPHNTPSSSIYPSTFDLSKNDVAVARNTSSVLPDIVRESQTVVTDSSKATEPLKYDNSHAVCTCPCQNYSLKLNPNVSLGDRILSLSVKGRASGEGLERNEMTWNELKVLAEMLTAEQRLLMQLDGTSLQLQVADCCH